MVVALWLILASLGLYAQSSGNKQEKAAIDHAKAALVSSLDDRLPKITLEYFLAYESEGAEIHWEVNDCGEQSGNPDADRDRDFPMCVEADFDLHHRAVTVSITIGTFKKGPSGNPALFSASITDPDGKAHPVQRLGDLPKELRRPLPRQIRDMSGSARAA
jgi:hypothetical protein